MDLQFSKYTDGLMPIIVQNADTLKVLMTGFMNEAALAETQKSKRVVFYSRSKQRLWMKGESSKNYLNLVSIHVDCDGDALLIMAKPEGPTCHTGTESCFGEVPSLGSNFLIQLESIIDNRINGNDDQSYIKKLFQKGINKVAQKVGEEAVEMVIEAKDNNDELFLNEGADLLFHYLLLLKAKGYQLKDVVQILKQRHQEKSS
jgi:phosphoribosyl-AMP cyclohydrolase / phosphoribosyl-ATP pyrophosphohydrolase